MKHNRTTINVAFAKSDEKGKAELLRHWAELRGMLATKKNQGGGLILVSVKEILGDK